jgi:hypothetical protein
MSEMKFTVSGSFFVARSKSNFWKWRLLFDNKSIQLIKYLFNAL